MIRKTRLRRLLGVGLLLAAGSTTAIALAQSHGSNEGHAVERTPAPHGQSGEHRALPHKDEHGADHGAGGHGEHGGGHGHGPEPINLFDITDKKKPALLALIINFGLLAGLYYKVGKKPIVEGLKQRRITIGKEIDEAQKMLAEAKERAKKYQQDLKNADTDAATAKASLVASGKGEVERLVTDATEKAERMRRDADRLVEQERKQLEQDLVRETVELAVREATSLIERAVTPEDHLRLANDLLAELARAPARPSVPVRGGVS